MIKVNHLIKKYGDNTIISDKSFVINQGDIVGIVGPSGSGKSSILNIIGCLDDDYSGNVIINDIQISTLSTRRRTTFVRQNINYIFQNFALVENESVQYNLELALYYVDLSKDEKHTLMKDVLKTVGIQEKLNEKVFTLSGGEQQRVAIARAMIKPGSIILADEPTGNLDDANKQEVIKILESLRGLGKTLIIATHDDDVMCLCDYIISLK